MDAGGGLKTFGLAGEGGGDEIPVAQRLPRTRGALP